MTLWFLRLDRIHSRPRKHSEVAPSEGDERLIPWSVSLGAPGPTANKNPILKTESTMCLRFVEMSMFVALPQ